MLSVCEQFALNEMPGAASVITDLNTDCLIKIFNWLEFSELLYLKRIHVAFDNAIQEICKTNSFKFKIDMEDEENVFKMIKLVDEFLLLFGDIMKKSKIVIIADPENEDYEFFLRCLNSLIANRCIGSNITSCKLYGFHLGKQFFKRHAAFFKSLESLNLIETKFIAPLNCAWLLDLFTGTQMKKLNLVKVAGNENANPTRDLMGRIASSELEWCSMSFSNYETDFTLNVPENYTLKNLCLEGILFNPNLLDKFVNIEVLNISVNADFDMSLSSIHNLKHLKCLVLRNLRNIPEIVDLLSKLAENDILELLTLKFSSLCDVVHPTMDLEYEVAHHLCRMKNLQDLFLETPLNLQRHFPVIGFSLHHKLQSFSYQQRKFHNNNNDNNDHDTEEFCEMILELANAANKLTQLTLKPATSRYNFQKFINALVEIRQNQGNKKMLFVKLPNGTTLSAEQERFVKGKFKKINKKKSI